MDTQEPPTEEAPERQSRRGRELDGHIGLDVHAASTTVAVVSQAGKRLKDFPVETNGRALVEAIRLIPGHKHVVFEDGTQSAWLWETLMPHVEEVVAGVTGSRGQKNDSLDAYGLADKLRTGTLDKRIFKAPQQSTLLRELARTHTMITRDLIRTCFLSSGGELRPDLHEKRSNYLYFLSEPDPGRLPTGMRDALADEADGGTTPDGKT